MEEKDKVLLFTQICVFFDITKEDIKKESN